jgi:Protein of unknown function (DUF4245)
VIGAATRDKRDDHDQPDRHAAGGRGAVPRRRRLAALLAAGLTCLVLCALFIVATPRPTTPTAVPISYQGDLVKFRRVAPHPVLAPRPLPAGWQPVSSRLTVVPGGAVSWHLGFVTPSGQLASLEESSERPAQFILRMTNDGNMLPGVQSGGKWWSRRWRPDKDQRSMYRSAPGACTIVVTGTAGWQELSVLADSLSQRP